MNANALSICIASTVLIAVKVFWELYLSPVARQCIPGPKRAAVSDAWSYWLLLQRRRTLEFNHLFESYGPVVRVGPNCIIFRNIDPLKAIYGTHKFRKSSWYNTITFGGVQNTLSTRDPAYHARCRRISAPAFRIENLRAAGQRLLHEMDVFVDRLRRDGASDAPVDVRRLFPLLTLDILGLAVLGVRFDQVASGQEHEMEKYIHSWIIDRLLVRLLVPRHMDIRAFTRLGPLPDTVASVIRKFPIPRLREIAAADSIITKYVGALYGQAEEKALDGCSSMLESYKAYRETSTGKPAPLPLVISDLSMNIVAGMESTGTSLVYIAYNLARSEKIWSIIRTEVSSVDFQADDFVDVLRGLPYMSAFIREVLRVHGPTSVYLERQVPPEGVTLEGYFIPGGTQVGGLAYSSHHDERIFPQAHSVDPLRWVQLDNDTGQYVNRKDITSAMNANWFPFGLGARSCSGKVLADLELSLATATMVKNFRIRLHRSTTPDSMSPVELGTLGPRAGRCLLHFEFAPTTA